MDYTANPLGTDNPAPKFSWKLKSNSTGVMQQKYHIAVASSSENLNSGNYIWQSEKNSDESVNIPYEGPELASRTRYYCKVTVTDNKGNKPFQTKPLIGRPVCLTKANGRQNG